MKPFLKWAGGKFRLIERIKAVLPPGKRLIEPFVGSGAVFLNAEYPAYLLADSNPDLINLYRYLQTEGPDFIAYGRTFFQPEQNEKSAFYTWRELFNQTKNPREKAALFLYLNKHGYNGLCRYNSQGKFNVPFGRYKQAHFPEAEMTFFWQKAQRAEFCQGSFQATLAAALPGDIVYCDPPYQALSKTANFTSYSDTPFGWTEQEQLADMARQLAGRGIPVLISNHDTTEIRNLYDGAELRYFSVQRFISCDGANRHKAPELLAYFAPAEKPSASQHFSTQLTS
jgi:DNA adenine methylase